MHNFFAIIDLRGLDDPSSARLCCMDIQDFLKRTDQNPPISAKTAKSAVILFNLLWFGCFWLWVIYLYGIAFLFSFHMGLAVYIYLLWYFSFPISLWFALATSMRLYRENKFRQAVRASCLPLAWILFYIAVVPFLSAFSERDCYRIGSDCIPGSPEERLHLYK